MVGRPMTLAGMDVTMTTPNKIAADAAMLIDDQETDASPRETYPAVLKVLDQSDDFPEQYLDYLNDPGCDRRRHDSPDHAN
jgi:hypothetical protein